MRTLKTIASYSLNVENSVGRFYFDVRNVWWQGIYPLSWNVQESDFVMFLG